jgi:hypothetical protein
MDNIISLRDVLQCLCGCSRSVRTPAYGCTDDSAISDMLLQYRGARSRPSLEGVLGDDSEAVVPAVLPSSTELFYFYGQTLDQCGKYTTGEPMKKLAKIYAKWLKVYSGEFN